jgi:hypothetical protein
MAETETDDVALMQTAVDRFAKRPGYMAHLLATLLAGDVSARRIADEFGCPPDTALRLALMRAPREERAACRQDIARIAGATSIDTVKLLSAVRQARALAAFGEGEEAMLMAARDVYPGTEDDEQ